MIKKVIAEMLYDTITRYEEKIKQMQIDSNKPLKKTTNLKGDTNEKTSVNSNN